MDNYPMNFEAHKKRSTEFANFYEMNDKKIDKSVLRFNVNPDTALRLKAQMMYLTGGYPVSQTHVFKDEIQPVVNGLFYNLSHKILPDPNSPIYDGLEITPDQVRTMEKYANTICEMAKDDKYKDTYITKTQIERHYENKYKGSFTGYPDPTIIRKIDIQKDYSSYKKKDASA